MHMQEFNEKNVRNAIIGVKNVRELGQRLKIPPHFLDDIEKRPPEHQKFKLVEEWFKVNIDCSWRALDRAMNTDELSEQTSHLEFTTANILAFIKAVTNWKDLGLQLGLKPAQISTCEGEEPKLKIIEQWKRVDPEANWEKLQVALESPAMCENRAARDIAIRRGSSFDKRSLLEVQSTVSSGP